MENPSGEKRRERGSNYTPDEKKLLFALCKKYSNIVDCKETCGIINSKKRDAWAQICKEYNAKASTGPRTALKLKTLYDNMKCMRRKQANAVSNNFIEKVEVKVEPFLDIEIMKEGYDISTANSTANSIGDHELTDLSCDGLMSEPADQRDQNSMNMSGDDPLNSIMNGTAGSEMPIPLNQPGSSEVVRLQINLLKQQTQNAMLEKKRIVQAIEAEATLMSLKLRTARLEATAAELRLPANHPSLLYNDKEMKAREYLQQ